MAFGEGVKITDDMIPDVAQQPEVMQAAAAMQKKMMEMMAHSA